MLAQTTPKRWLREERVAYVKTLLANTSLTVVSIVLAAGFESASALRKAFVTSASMALSKYRTTCNVIAQACIIVLLGNGT